MNKNIYYKYQGNLKAVLFKKDDFMIGVLRTEKDNEIRFLGNFYGVDKGEDLIITGNWVNHQRYGKQLNVISWERPMPDTEEQVISFLSSGLVKGVGKKRAKDIVNKLGSNAVKVISEQGEKSLSGIRGIGKKTAQGIVSSVKETFEVQEIIAELLNFGISAQMTLKLYNNYGEDTVQTVKRNPYVLTEIQGVGFLKADEIARNIGILPTSGYRINACVEYVLQNLCHSNGHCYIMKNELIEQTLKVLNHNIDTSKHIEENEMLLSLYNLEDQTVVIEGKRVYPKYLFEYEERLARKLAIMQGYRDGEAMPFLDNHIKDFQKKNNVILANNQREAIKTLMQEQLLVLTGGPGTGKTTVVKAIIDVFKKVNPKANVLLTAPTGRASQKLADSTGMEASTIHRAIGYIQGEAPQYHDSNKLEADLVIIDEMSMVDVSIAHWLFNALRNDTKVLFIGDVDQLPSVGSGNVLHDLIKAHLPIVRLTEIFRQAEQSQIVTNAHRINNGKSLLVDEDKDDFYFIRQDNIEKIRKLIILSAMRFQSLGYSIKDILVLSPMRKGEIGTQILNEELRNSLNPKSNGKLELHIGKRFFREGDKVLHNINNPDKDIFNGEIGIVKEITKEKNDKGEIVDVMICDYDGKDVKYHRHDINEVELAYSITIHKSQGGEAPIVIMPISTAHHIMLTRNLYYTGMTRAIEKVVLIGTDSAMDIAINNNKTTNRNTELDSKTLMFKESIAMQKQHSN